MSTTLSRWQKIKDSQAIYNLSRDKVTLIALTIFLVIVSIAALSPLIAPHNPYDIASLDIMDAELPPFWVECTDGRFLLGTDDQGRDILSSVMHGLKVSLTIGLLAVALQVILGIFLGVIAGYFGGKVDSLLMRLADIQLSFSTMMVAIIVLAIFQASFGAELYSQLAMIVLILVIGIAEWPWYARTIRACVLAEKEKEYVQASVVMGLGHIAIMFRHILPNCLSPIIVISTVQVANAIISEAMLSFLGLGMPPTQPSLGALINSGFEYIFSGAWWITLIPGVVLVVLILCINLLGDFLRDLLNPKMHHD